MEIREGTNLLLLCYRVDFEYPSTSINLAIPDPDCSTVNLNPNKRITKPEWNMF